MTAKDVITAIPINVINDIEYEPALSKEKQQLSTKKQATDKGTSCGQKFVA